MAEMTEEEKAAAQARYKEEATFFVRKAIEVREMMPEHEEKESWLPHLLDAYAIINGAIQHLIESEKAAGHDIACKAGCALCCFQDVPVSPLEALGVYYAVHFYVQGDIKEVLHAQLAEQKGNKNWSHGKCPFQIESKCSIYPLRPIACRNLIVVDEPCKERTFDEIAGTNLSLYEYKRENCRLPSNVALQMAYIHMSKICGELGIIDKEAMLNFDSDKDLFFDIRMADWLNHKVYSRFFVNSF